VKFVVSQCKFNLKQPNYSFVFAVVIVCELGQKIHQKYVSSPETFDTLQKILLCEMNAGQSKLASSATLSLLWLNR